MIDTESNTESAEAMILTEVVRSATTTNIKEAETLIVTKMIRGVKGVDIRDTILPTGVESEEGRGTTRMKARRPIKRSNTWRTEEARKLTGANSAERAETLTVTERVTGEVMKAKTGRITTNERKIVIKM